MLSEENILLAYAMAKQISGMSTCRDKQVGVAILDKGGDIIATGYNYVEECRHACDVCPVIHAETVVMMKLSLFDKRPLYSVQTLFPCEKCQLLLHKRGIKKVYYYKKTKQCLGLMESECIENIIDGGSNESSCNKENQRC